MSEETLPIEVAEFWANRRGKAVIASLLLAHVGGSE
jgi:hypothetical protein